LAALTSTRESMAEIHLYCSLSVATWHI